MKSIFRFLRLYLGKWWIPISSYFLVIIIFWLGTIFRRDWIIDLSLAVLYLNMLGNVMSSIVQIMSKRWYLAIPQLGISVFLFCFTGFIFMFSPPDYYGASKTIPKDMVIDEPLDEVPNHYQFKEHDLILADSIQPGIYLYFTNYNPERNGFFYIKAFEITTNDRLSKDRINRISRIEVNIKDKSNFNGKFTVYEGSWGDKYGARIELWFKPVGNQKEYLVAQRNYIIEGWMR
ncbi:MAG: hypothetical protein AAGG59_14660 [Bacteroidota bacterium]